MILKIINYAVRIIIVLLGIALVTGFLAPPGSDETMFRVFGVIFILFGLYRIAVYYTKSKQYDFRNDKEE